jgi:hypothetical protein
LVFFPNAYDFYTAFVVIVIGGCSDDSAEVYVENESLSDEVPEAAFADEEIEEVVEEVEEIPKYITIKGEQYITALKRLDLSNKGLTNADIEPLKYMVNLTYLDVQLNPQLNDISALAGLTNLEYLYLYDNGGIKDISALAGLTKLIQLRIENNQISDITPLVNLKNLNILDIRDNQINDISALMELKNLSVLAIQGNQVSDEQINEFKTAFPNVDLYY